jgi:hypothetical protein
MQRIPTVYMDPMASASAMFASPIGHQGATHSTRDRTDSEPPVHAGYTPTGGQSEHHRHQRYDGFR